MRGIPIGIGLCIVMTLLGISAVPAFSFQEPATPLPQRIPHTPEPLGALVPVATVILAEPSLDAVAAAADAEGLSELERFARLTFHWLRLVNAQRNLIQILTSPPFNAALVEQAFVQQNSITIRVQADLVRQIETLPGVASVYVGSVPRPPEEPTEIPRQELLPGTRVPPIQPPGFD